MLKKITGACFLVFIVTLLFGNYAFAEEFGITSGLSVVGKADSEKDNHTYHFTTDKDGEAYITLDHTTGGFSMHLYNEHGDMLDGDYVDIKGHTIIINENLPEGAYYLKVLPYEWDGISSASYRIKATYPSSSGIARDTKTFEPNDTMGTSVPLNSGEIHTAIAETGIDRDVYQFTNDQDGETYITLDQAIGDFTMQLYDALGNRINDYYWDEYGNTIVIDRNLAKGTYYLKVTPYWWSGISSAAYRIKATYPSSFTRNISSFEPNETIETSMAIKSGEFYKSIAETELDKDTYQFTTNHDGEAYISLDQTTGGFSIKLYDMYGNEINNDSEQSGENLIIKDRLKKGTYYIKVVPYEWSGIKSATYRLKATYPASFTRDLTSYEPNDTVETSMKLISNNTYSSNSYSDIDQDVYQFTTYKSGNANIKLDNIQGGFSLYLYDSNGSYVDYYETSYAGYALELDELLAPGTYYIKINPYYWNGISSAKYRLKASFSDKTPIVNSPYDTSTVLNGQAVSGTKVVAVAGTQKIGETTAKDGKFSITIAKQKTGTKIGVYTIDSADNQSSTKTTTVIDASIKAGATAYNQIKISWLQLPGAQGYEIYQSSSSTGTYSNVGTVTSGNALNFTNSNLATGSTYYYKVRAYWTVNGKKVYSSFSEIAYAKPALATVTSAKAASVGYSKNKISWAKTSGASGYEVYRATSKAGTYTKVKAITNGSAVSYENTGLTTGRIYYYKVRAYRTVSGKNVYGAYSGIVNAAPTLSSPAKITVAKASSTSVKASWSKVTEATGYELYRATSKSGTYTKVKTQTSGSSVSYTNTGLSKGKTYYYKVRTYRTVSGKKIYSPYTSVVSYKL